tara:strand:+ start:161 stop:964 length:804 start_codon:yes stop_codon:yes gene_type:complete
MSDLSPSKINSVIKKLTHLKKTKDTTSAASASSSHTDIPIAIFMCGPTASGKSTIKQYIAKGNKLDSYVNLDQDEVSKIFKDKTRDFVRKTTLHTLFPKIIDMNKNIIVDRTCRDVTDTIIAMNYAKNMGYYIILAFSYVDKDVGLERLIKRNKKGRVVPTDIYENIYDDYENRIIKRYFIEREIPYDEIVLFDNNGKQVKQIMYKKKDKLRISKDKDDFLFYGTTLRDIAYGLNNKKTRRKTKKGGKNTKKYKRKYNKSRSRKRFN